MPPAANNSPALPFFEFMLYGAKSFIDASPRSPRPVARGRKLTLVSPAARPRSLVATGTPDRAAR